MPDLDKGGSGPSRDPRVPKEEEWVARRLEELKRRGYTPQRAAKQIEEDKWTIARGEEEERCPTP